MSRLLTITTRLTEDLAQVQRRLSSSIRRSTNRRPFPKESSWPSLLVRTLPEVERRFSVVEELEAVVSADVQRATSLWQAILGKASAGEFV